MYGESKQLDISLCCSLFHHYSPSWLILDIKQHRPTGWSKDQGHHRSVDTCILAGLRLSGFQRPAECVQDKATEHISD